MTTNVQPTYLMCAPDWFGVEYVINPWMKGHIGDVDQPRALEEWRGLLAILEGPLGASIQTIGQQAGLPDMVFTANAGLVHRNVFVPSRFKHPERQGEEPLFEAWFRAAGWDVSSVDGYHEGAGDMLFFSDGVLFAASGFRTDPCVHSQIAKKLGVSIQTLELADPRFYHLDTCFCPLPGGRLLWFPDAFSGPSVAKVERSVDTSKRHAVTFEEASRFACNAVATPGHVVLNDCAAETESWLGGHGFQLHRTPLDEFMKAGGAAKCLTLRLDSGP